MSKLDYLTISIVVIAIAAIIFLLVKTKSLLSSNGKDEVAEIEDVMKGRYSDDEYEINEEDLKDSGIKSEGEANTEEATAENSTDDDSAKADEAVSGDTENATSATDEDIDYSKDDEAKATTTENTPETEEDATAISNTYDDNDGEYMVIAGSFKFKHNAENMVKILTNKGYSDSRVSIFDKGAYASVIVDRFDNEADAKRLSKELYDSHRIEAYVLKKR